MRGQALRALESRLALGFSGGLKAPEALCDPEGMAGTLAKIRRDHDSPAVEADKRTIAVAISYLRRNGKPDGWRGLKYACIGVCSHDERGWLPAADEAFLAKLLGFVEAEDEERRRLKCMQMLLMGYWTFRSGEAAPAAADGWRALRAWLRTKLDKYSSSAGKKPGWFETLRSHRNLLGENPCQRYGSSLLAGDASELKLAVEGLGIPLDSWVQEEAALAQIKAAVALPHDRFRAAMPTLVDLASDKGGIRLSPGLKTRCVAALVSRYSRCPDKPEHMALRDAALAVVGNPWLRRASWDASVTDESGNPDNAAREMVNGWLKRRLISDFFELLSADGAGDTRRLEYWLRFEPYIDDMWFSLGADAQYARGESFNDFRQRARGRLLDLDGTTADNNAFVMRIGEHLAVEFGVKGNACYIFRWGALPPRLEELLTSGLARPSVAIALLKWTPNVGRLIHMDSASKGMSWEQKFDQAICPLVGRRPDKPPARIGEKPAARPDKHAKPVSRVIKADPAPRERVSAQSHAPSGGGALNPFEWNMFVKDNGLRTMDNRKSNGALWVLAESLPAHIEAQLSAWGFRLKPGKGWWRE